MSVKTWPTYLLRDIPDHLRAQIEEDADLDGRAMIEIIRDILCGHYDLDCPPVDSRPPAPEEGTTTMVLRLQPELWEAIKADAGRDEMTYGATKRVVLGILENHYAGVT